MNNLKRILTIALCSVLLVCAIPQFSLRSEAASTATYALYQTLLNLSGYLTTRGYSIVHKYGSSIPSVTDFQSMTYDNMGQLLFDFALKLNAFGATHDVPDLGDQFIDAVSSASLRGSLLLSKTIRDLVDLYLYTQGSSASVGTAYSSFESFSYPNTFTFEWNVSNWGKVSFANDTVFVYGTGNSGYFFPADPSYFTYNALTDAYYWTPDFQQGFTESSAFTYDGKTYYLYNGRINRYSGTANFTGYTLGIDVSSVFQLFMSDSLPDINSGDLVVSQITDTSESDLLTSTNTIASDGTVEGDTTIYLPDQATLETAIDGYNQGTISYEDFLKVFGINSVASDATVQEKEDALTVVVTPTDDYLWFTKTQWGADSLEETRKASASTRSEEDSLANSIANTLNGGSDPEEDEDGKSRGKGLLALLLLGLGIWNTPIIAGDGTPDSGGTDDGSTDGSGDTSGYLQESIAGMAVAGGIVEDLFSAAGGSDGYGLAYTVGASFVIFSVIIGAANYFGALFSGSDTKQNIKSSGKQSRSKSPSPKSKKGG